MLSAFGFGRRICRGRHLADATLWISMVNILAAFDISSVLGKDEQGAVPEIKFVGTTLRRGRPLSLFNENGH